MAIFYGKSIIISKYVLSQFCAYFVFEITLKFNFSKRHVLLRLRHEAIFCINIDAVWNVSRYFPWNHYCFFFLFRRDKQVSWIGYIIIFVDDCFEFFALWFHLPDNLAYVQNTSHRTAPSDLQCKSADNSVVSHKFDSVCDVQCIARQYWFYHRHAQSRYTAHSNNSNRQ